MPTQHLAARGAPAADAPHGCQQSQSAGTAPIAPSPTLPIRSTLVVARLAASPKTARQCSPHTRLPTILRHHRLVPGGASTARTRLVVSSREISQQKAVGGGKGADHRGRAVWHILAHFDKKIARTPTNLTDLRPLPVADRRPTWSCKGQFSALRTFLGPCGSEIHWLAPVHWLAADDSIKADPIVPGK